MPPIIDFDPLGLQSAPQPTPGLNIQAAFDTLPPPVILPVDPPGTNNKVGTDLARAYKATSLTAISQPKSVSSGSGGTVWPPQDMGSYWFSYNGSLKKTPAERRAMFQQIFQNPSIKKVYLNVLSAFGVTFKPSDQNELHSSAVGATSRL